jgi:hypothetical protein
LLFGGGGGGGGGAAGGYDGGGAQEVPQGEAVLDDSIKTRVESAPGVRNLRLKLRCDEPLSNFAFNFNLRRYSKKQRQEVERKAKVWQCRLTVSKSVLTAPLATALETQM